MKYSMGLLPDREDTRDILMASYIPKVTLPINYDCQGEMGSVRDQGSEGSCGGHAAAGMKEWQEFSDSLKFCQLSPRYVYEKSREIESVNGEGTTLRAVMKALYQYGICQEALWPYVARLKGKPDPRADEDALNGRITAYAKLNDIPEILQSLMINGPGLIGLYVTPEWNNVPESGIMKKVRKNAHRFGGHAICYVGFDRARGLLKFKNSWGMKWGDHGYGYLPFESVEEQWISAWSATDIIENEIINDPIMYTFEG